MGKITIVHLAYPSLLTMLIPTCQLLGRMKVCHHHPGKLLTWKILGLVLIIGSHSTLSHAGNTTLLNNATQTLVNLEGESTMQPIAKGNQYQTPSQSLEDYPRFNCNVHANLLI